MPLDFIVRGEVVTAQKLIVEAPKPKPRAKPDGQASYHKGFRVEGHPPGSLEAAKGMRDREIALCRNSGGREPKPFDEDHWRRTSPLKAVRGRPFDVQSSADECKALAERTGWLDVRVHELKKGEPEALWS